MSRPARKGRLMGQASEKERGFAAWNALFVSLCLCVNPNPLSTWRDGKG